MIGEFMRNPYAQPLIECDNCKETFLLGQGLQQEPLPYPHNTVEAVYIVCPFCSHRKFCYVMTERLRYLQLDLKKKLAKWQESRTSPTFKAYRMAHRIFQTHFERAQKKYVEEFVKEISRVGDPSGI